MTPTQDFRRTVTVAPRELPKGLDSLVARGIGAARRSSVVKRRLERAARVAYDEFLAMESLGSVSLKSKIAEQQTALRRSPGDRSLEKKGLALAAEVARRTLGLRAHFVQILGALILLEGALAEMATGEGKTLVVGLAATVAGWSARPVHVVTANDYLAERDETWLSALFSECGLNSGSVIGTTPQHERRATYAKEIVYTTSKELLADHLRDRLVLGTMTDGARRHLRFLLQPSALEKLGVVQRGLHTVFVDEADNLLIDEAVTPLIISQPQPNDALREACEAAHEMASKLERGRDYKVNLALQSVELTDKSAHHASFDDTVVPGVFAPRVWREDLLKQAIKAREFFHRDRQYVVDDGKLHLVDESTGRLMPNRSWRQGLHQAVEAKEGVELSDPTETIARMSFQRFFRMFQRLGGLTGTASEARDELWLVFGLAVIPVGTNKTLRRIQLPDQFFATQADKWDAVVKEARRLSEAGRAILIGTRTIAASEEISRRLFAANIPHRVLNAVRHHDEATVIAEAGQSGQITVATNMAGRGTDIRLSTEAEKAGGLHVIATERNSSRRIDRQLFGRAGRQGDPGSAQAFVALDDDLFIQNLLSIEQRVIRGIFRTKLPGYQILLESAVARAQSRAQKRAFSQRKGVMAADRWMEEALSFARAV
jgi:preprotein translocase subunit SecA